MWNHLSQKVFILYNIIIIKATIQHDKMCSGTIPDFTASPNASEEWQLMTKSTIISHAGSQVASANADKM